MSFPTRLVRRTVFRCLVRTLTCVLLAVLLCSCAGDSTRPPAPVPREPAKAKIKARYYIVKSGDTLSEIGLKTGHRYRQLAVWNRIKPPYIIYPGQKIQLYASPWRSPSKPKKTTPVKRKRKAPAPKKSAVYAERKRSVPAAAENQSKKTLKVYWEWPLKGVIERNFSQTGRKGIDIAGVLGQPVKAAAAGKVVYSGQGLIGYGNLVIVKHNDEYLSAYANNRRLLVQEGDRISTGQKIAEVGSVAGKGPSLHFEIRKHGKPVNPVPYLPKR